MMGECMHMWAVAASSLKRTRCTSVLGGAETCCSCFLEREFARWVAFGKVWPAAVVCTVVEMRVDLA